MPVAINYEGPHVPPPVPPPVSPPLEPALSIRSSFSQLDRARRFSAVAAALGASSRASYSRHQVKDVGAPAPVAAEQHRRSSCGRRPSLTKQGSSRVLQLMREMRSSAYATLDEGGGAQDGETNSKAGALGGEETQDGRLAQVALQHEEVGLLPMAESELSP